MSDQAALGWFIIIVGVVVWVFFALRQKTSEEKEKRLTQLMCWAIDIVILLFLQSTVVNFYHREYWQLFSPQIDIVIVSDMNKSQMHPPSVVLGAIYSLVVWNMLGFSFAVYQWLGRGAKKLHEEDDPKELEQLKPEG